MRKSFTEDASRVHVDLILACKYNRVTQNKRSSPKIE